MFAETTMVKSERDALQAKIDDGVRVWAETDVAGYLSCSKLLITKNATLIFDEDHDVSA